MNPFKYLIMIPFGWVLRQLYTLLGNYGLALIVFSLLVKVILIPFSIKSKKSMMRMNRVSPMLNALKRKYGDDQQKYNQAVAELYQKEHISPMGGCLWSLLPMLIIFPLYYVIRSPLTYVVGLTADQVTSVLDVLAKNGIEIATSGQNSFYYQITAAAHIHQYIDQIRAVVPDILDINYNFLGVNLSAEPAFFFWKEAVNWNSIGLFLLPWLSGASQLLSSLATQKLNNSVATNERGEKDEAAAAAANSSTKTMLYMMPLISVWIGFSMPASISIYWIAQAVFSVAQEALLTRMFRKEYDAEDAEKKLRILEAEAEEAEKARIRAEKRAAGLTDGTENTSKKKLAKQLEQQKKRELAEKFGADEEPAEKTPDELKGYSGDPERPYCRGRSYKPERYGRKDEE